MSIKPTYSARIFRGEKDIELRRTVGRLAPGDLIIVYASSPVCAVVGGFVVTGMLRASFHAMWRRHRAAMGVSFAEYSSYFDGVDEANGIEIGARVEIEPVALDALRARFSGFRPPQSYMYWRGPAEDLLGASAKRVVMGRAATSA
jgi:predicted transcriptional regulator